MKKNWKIAVATMLVMAGLVSGCANTETKAPVAQEKKEVTESENTTNSANTTESENTTQAVTVRVGSLKGATSMGLVSMMDQAAQSKTGNNYEFTMVTAADELTAMIASKNVDIALVPANVAAILYNKTQGGISVIDINTLGVLYMVSGNSQITDIASLKGKTVYLTGKGTTPDYVLQYLLEQNGLTTADVTLEYKSEPTEVVSILAADPNAIGLLPQPFSTVACLQNQSLKEVIDLNAAWKQVQGETGGDMVTGVTIVRKEFLAEHEDAVTTFLAEHKASVLFAGSNTEQAAALVVKAGIIEKEPVAAKAIPKCNIVYIDGAEMKQSLAGYLEVLSEQNAETIGQKLPADDFYYGAE